MPIQVLDANSLVQGAPIFVDPVYRFSGAILATNTAAAKDCFQLTGAPSGTVARIVSARFRLVGGGTASGAGGVPIQMLRVTAAPTGQTNVAITGRPHDLSAAAAGTTGFQTPQGSQTAGTSAIVLGSDVMAVDLLTGGSYAGDLFQTAAPVDFFCGPQALQQPIIIGAGLFVTWRLSAACPTASVLYYDIAITEATS